MITEPLVSICIPTYNGAEFIYDALQSIKNQTYGNLEVVVSDDASIDNTVQLIQNFEKETTIPIFIHNHKPQGIGANWNNCIKHANGEYVKFLFQDDVLMHDCVQKMVAFISSEPKVGMVYCKRKFIFNNEDKYFLNWIEKYKNLHQTWKNFKVASGVRISGKKLLKNENLLEFPKNKIGEPTAVLIKKDVFNKVGLFSESLKQSLDIEFWFRLMKFYDLIFIDEALISFRLHHSQTSSKNKGKLIFEESLFNKSIYKNLFWQLSFKNKKNLFFQFNIVVVFFKRLRGFLKRKIKK